MSSPTPTPTRWPASTACGAEPSSTRWDGTTTGSPPSAGCRTTSVSAATPPSPSTPTSSHRRSRRRNRCPSRVPTSSPSAISSPPRTSRSSSTCGGCSGCPSTGRGPTPPCRNGPKRCPSGASYAWSAAVRWCSGPPPPSGTSISARRCPRPSSRTGTVRPPTTGSGSRGSAPTARSMSRPPVPSCCPPVWPWSPTPTTTATAPCSGPRSAPPCSACGCRCSPTRWPIRTRGRASP